MKAPGRAIIAAVLFAAVLLGGCGKKGNPLPPGAGVPGAQPGVSTSRPVPAMPPAVTPGGAAGTEAGGSATGDRAVPAARQR
jgi:hypothetical protein